MKFTRYAIDVVDTEALRALGAREGWLLETPEALRVGAGEVIERVELEGGLGVATDAVAVLERHRLSGTAGPAGSGVVAFATLPFDRSAGATLSLPEFVVTRHLDGSTWLTTTSSPEAFYDRLAGVDPPVQDVQRLTSLTYQPTPEEYARHVAMAVEILRRKEIDKVVLARAVLGTVAESIDPAAIAGRLRRREPICTLYSLPTDDGRRFVGASPELLVRRLGAEIQCHPLAGTITLPPNVAPDDYETWLLGSTKNLHEHAVVVDEIVSNLSQVYDDISADAEPSIVALATVAHLGTWVSARWREEDRAPDALEVVRMLHPTAAVGGMPRENAYRLLRRLEEHDRGNYAGPLGWIDAEGDGEWWIGLRGVLLRENEFEAWAGAGIVSESDPIAEREETRDKLAVVLGSLLSDAL